jgi:hypothetical protein
VEGCSIEYDSGAFRIAPADWGLNETISGARVHFEPIKAMRGRDFWAEPAGEDIE